MKRVIRTVIVFLLLGAIVNVAVAWGLAMFAPASLFTTGRQIEAPDRWPQYLEELDWPTPKTAFRSESLQELSGVTSISVYGPVTELAGPDVLLHVHQFGWPFRSLQWEDPGSAIFEPMSAAAAAVGSRGGFASSRTEAGRSGIGRCRRRRCGSDRRSTPSSTQCSRGSPLADT